MWAWLYAAGGVVTFVCVCRWAWRELHDESEDWLGEGTGRALAMAVGVLAGLAWPLVVVSLLARDLLWPEVDPDARARETDREYRQ